MELRLRHLPARRRFAFAAACAERAWCLVWRKREKIPQPEIVLSCRRQLNEAWDWIEEIGPKPSECGPAFATLIEQFSDSCFEDTRSAAVICYGTALMIEEGTSEEAFRAADENLALLENLIVRSLDLYSPGYDNQQIDSHPLMLAEIVRQTADLDVLSSVRDSKSIQWVRARSHLEPIVSETVPLDSDLG